MKTAISLVAVLVLVAIVGVGAYDLGQSAGEANAQNIRADFIRSRSTTGQADTSQPGQSAARERPLASGTIQSFDGNVMQVAQQDGSSVTVALGAQTVVEKTVAGAPSDLKAGLRVSVQGVQATGQVNAQVIQILPGTP